MIFACQNGELLLSAKFAIDNIEKVYILSKGPLPNLRQFLVILNNYFQRSRSDFYQK